MKRQLQVLAAAAVVCAAPSAFASTIGLTGSPSLEIYWRSGTDPNAPVQFVGEVVLAVDDEGNFVGGNQSFTWGTGANQDTINVSLANGNFDPFMNLAVGVVDSGAPSIFGFIFSSPLVPTIPGLASWQLDLAGSFSQGSPNDGGSIAVALPNTTGVLEGLLDGSVVSGIGGAAIFPSGGSSTYGPFTASGVFDCATIGGCSSFTSRLAFLGSGGSDAFSFTGRFEVMPIPVPAAVWLLGSAVGLLGWMRRRAT